ncbi:2'-5' RNA ligase family protein [Hymenobacter lapidiphilus]|uniref:2'-5' RNA ligase family protein n=1 Tax=Hymenobacter sp. CCM 8763 TaxID=2303334 RepID=UPI000E34A16E|nr:2'-5' RNA ligase family protein [Hymenobacter sp. CCM 8763]RFP65953.1 2'-5' RNA ligase family protein [Hymenobacter sp. CCM 8763]
MPDLPPTAIDAPLILTLLLNEEAQQHFDRLRTAHFPPARNYLRAHVTLFHHLPGIEYATIAQHLQVITVATPPLSLRVSGVRFLGQGVAYSLENDQLRQLHRELQTHWAATLRPQDLQPLRPHITVQNKVAPAVARTLYEQLSTDFEPYNIAGTGLALWAYRGGPWEALAQFPFERKP